ARASIAAQGRELARRGAAAVILVADSVGEIAFQSVAVNAGRGLYDVDDPATNAAGGRYGGPGGGIPVLLAHRGMLGELRASGQPARIRLITESFDYPSVNVVGIARGSDPRLRHEYVMFSSHTDHDGVRFPVDGDSIWNGADDNGSTSVALLAIARAFAKQPAKRSALFVWHGAEERGLLGSRYHAVHPVVPLRDIVAVLNGDLIGRNNPDTASLLGVQPPHRNSTDLVRMALEANAATGKFVLDSTWDRPTHPEGWYFRSDHVPYVRHGVPALMYSTNLHPDYHTPRDEPSRIDYAKLTRMTDWMYMTGWLVANAPRRPAVDPGFKLER
ncbi:MAG: M28 family peptidase, partial [Gemmatimonadota bacterium]|nr:M28 family peptidase [Gemmatimonadota bacterium]